MLTILTKRANGSECLSEAHSVELSSAGDTKGTKTFFVFSGPNDNCPETIHLAEPGDALFVMNRHGGTVAKYHCDFPPLGWAGEPPTGSLRRDKMQDLSQIS